MRVYAVACARQLELHDAYAVSEELFSCIHEPHDEQENEHHRHEHHDRQRRLCAADVGVLVLHLQRVVQAQRVFGEAVHDLVCPHVASVVHERVGLLVVLAQQAVGFLEVACPCIIAAQVAVAYVSQVVARVCRYVFAVEQACHLAHVVLPQGDAYLYGVHIISGHGVVHAQDILLHHAETAFRLFHLAEVQIHVCQVEAA